MLGQFKPVGARHRDAFFFQRADHRLEKGVAAAHQNHDVARPDRPAFALGFDGLAGAGFKPARDGLGDAPRGGDGRIGCVLIIERQFPVALFLRNARRDHVPDFHAGRQAAFPRLMNRAHVIGLRREATKVFRKREHLVHRVEDALRRAKGQSQIDRVEGSCPPRRRDAGTPPFYARTARERRLETKKSTVSRRRPRKMCRVRWLWPSPAKKSLEIRSRISHCAALVSCASSTRI